MSGCPGPLQLLPNCEYQRSSGANVPWLSVAGLAGLDLSDIYSTYRLFAWPGLMGPTRAGQAKHGSQAEQSSGQVVEEMRTNLARAEQFHKSVERIAHPNTLALYSAGLATDVRVEFDAYPAAEGAEWVAPTGVFPGDSSSSEPRVIVHKENAGDGTVPEASASCPSLSLAKPAEFREGSEHSSVCASAAFQSKARTMIQLLLAVPHGTRMSPP
jgi:hypothetical protein